MKIMIFILGMFLGFNSCSDTKDKGIALQGEWELTQVICHCAFDEHKNFRTSKLLFDNHTTKVTVIHKGDDAFFHASGNYRYTIQKDTITLKDDTRSYTYKIEDNVLTLEYVDNPMIADDEVSFRYIRK